MPSGGGGSGQRLARRRDAAAVAAQRHRQTTAAATAIAARRHCQCDGLLVWLLVLPREWGDEGGERREAAGEDAAVVLDLARGATGVRRACVSGEAPSSASR